MKQTLSFAICLAAAATLFAQNDSITPILADEAIETRALIVGISDYQDTLIGDLKYAHKDAEIFADYLRSDAGGALPEQDIWLMTNKDASLGAIDNALNWLIKETKKGDKVIIYFSGHGDVEKSTLWQRGYLLAYNTPSRNYRNNAIRIEDLDEIITTLSVGKDAKVIVILDACRSGKLAGNGPSLTAKQLEKQVQNEVRILSCRSDQKSLEGNLWGDGRGLFSYYFINGMRGLADKEANSDKVVSFEELQFFLEKNMAQAVKDPRVNARQNPVFVGDEYYPLAQVRDDALAVATREISMAASSPATAARKREVAEKTPEGNLAANLNMALQAVDFSTAVLKPDFETVLAKNDPTSLFAFFAQSTNTPMVDGEAARLALAARLHDQAQEVINLYLQGDARTLDQRNYTDQAEKYVQYPRLLQAALVLLPKGHLLRKKVEVKLLYFDGVCTRLAGQMSDEPKALYSEAIAKQKKALALDDKAAYVHNELGLLYLANKKMDEAEKYFKTAAKLAPTWALPHANLCATYLESSQLQKAIVQGDSAIALQPDYFGSYVNLGNVYEKKHDYLKAETCYRKARELNDAHYLPFERRAFLQLETGRYEEADWQFYEMELRKQGMVAPIGIPNVVATPMAFYNPPFDYPSLSGPGVLDENPKTAQAAFLTGKYYFEQNRMNEAIGFFKKAKQLDPSHEEVYYYLGIISKTAKDYESAEVYFAKLIELRPEVEFMPLFLAEVYHDWQRPHEEEVIYRRFIANSKDTRILTKAHLQLSDLLDLQKRFSDRELVLWNFQKINDDWANYELAAFYSNMVFTNPNNTDWLFRYADFNKKHGASKTGTELYEQLLQKDSLHAASAYIHALLGKYYLEETPKPEFSETRQNWKLEFPKAVQHLKSAIALAPGLPSAHYDLARACTSIFEYDEALSVLRNLRDSNDLNLSSRLLLADLEMREGNTEIASGLLQKAVDMLPATTHELASLQGKLAQLKAAPKTAIENYKTAISLQKNDSNMAYSIARLYANLGNHDEALNWLDTAIANEFDHKLVIKYDPAWEAFRNETKFFELVKRIEKEKN
ncbi:MAG: tetratricopeptide repeat protein [Saprospiraceae bacterium]|nr:tetratricopeptide repeat protein [Saprospiraceae bacterium]